MSTRRPAEVFPPGEFLREEIEARGWSQVDLAAILDRPANTINEIITAKRGITPETARGLAAAFGTSPEYWLNLEAAYQLSKVREDKGDAISRRARLYAKAPIKEMMRRGWIEPSDNVAILESQILRFFQIERIDDEPTLIRHAARKSTKYDEPLTPSQQAWLMRASQLARAAPAGEYQKGNVADVVRKLRLMMHAPQEIRHVPRVLADAGIRLVVVEPLSGSKIDGACFWIEESPVIAITIRFNRIDNFWFVLMHELGHVDQGEAAFDVELEAHRDGEKPREEQMADHFANEHLVPSRQLDSFVARVGPLYSARRVEAFAQANHVHPGIVVGQLQYRGEVPYSSFRKMMEPIRERITAVAVTDGWGASLPVEL